MREGVLGRDGDGERENIRKHWAMCRNLGG